MEFLLDTNICIYIIKNRPISVRKKFESLDPGQIGISSITLAELKYGVEKSGNPQKNQNAIELFLHPLSIYSFDARATEKYGKIRAFLEKNGTPIGPLDTLIAAHAMSLNQVLVTNNIKEFSRVPQLKLENWVETSI